MEKMSLSDTFPDSGSNATLYVHAGATPDPTTGAILPSICQSTTFVQESVENYLSKGYSYSRQNNPTVAALEKKITEIENGAGTVCFSSGMAATTTVMSCFLNAKDHCVMPTCCYGGTYRAARVFFTRLGVEFSFVDFRDPQKVAAAIKSNTKMVFVETPANPTLWLTDLEAINDVINEAENERKTKGEAMSLVDGSRSILCVCDSTFATPYMLSPFKYGVDIILHSTTKFFDGHNITTGGAAISLTKAMHEKVSFTRNVLGNIMSPQTAFYTLVTMMTLPLRIIKQCENAIKIAEFLQQHTAVQSVLYPGLSSFGQREIAAKYHKNNLHGSMLGFEVKGGVEAGKRLMNAIGAPFTLCENLGSVQSLITCPAVFTHAQMSREEREAIGITDGFIRMSVGIEEVSDLIKALEKALILINN